MIGLNEKQIEAILSQDGFFKIFDWYYFVDLIKVCNIKNAQIGLYEDWDATSATALQNGEMTNGLDESKFGIYLGSWWATPCVIDLDTYKKYDCFSSISEEDFTDSVLDTAEEWWPIEAAKYFADRIYCDTPGDLNG